MAPHDKISVELTRSEALVLFEFLRRCDENDEYKFADQAEQRVLWNLECLLERSLVEPFDPAYDDLLRNAWAEIRDSKDLLGGR